MNRLFIFLILVSLIGCGDDTKSGELVFDGGFSTTIAFNDIACFHGAVKNLGDGTAYNAQVTIQVFNVNGTIIDVALGFPADLSDIQPGQRATFKACAFDVSANSIAFEKTRSTIEWLNR